MRHCQNSAAADEHAYTEGKLSKREIALNNLSDEMLETLLQGGELTIDINKKAYYYDASSILADHLGRPIYEALDGWCTMHSTMRLDHLKRINEESAAEDRADSYAA